MDKVLALIEGKIQQNTIMNLYTGFGKTVFALNLFIKIGVKTLIVVNKKTLLE